MDDVLSDYTRLILRYTGILRSHFLGAGDYAVTILSNDISGYLMSCAINRVGAIEVHLPRDTDARGINAAIERYQPKIVLLDDFLVDRLADENLPAQDETFFLPVSEVGCQGYMDRLATLQPVNDSECSDSVWGHEGSDLAALIYAESGGEPVPRTHRQWMQAIANPVAYSEALSVYGHP